VEFPIDLYLKFVFYYMFSYGFGIAIAIILPMVIYTTCLSIVKVIFRLTDRILKWRWFHVRRKMKRQLELQNSDYASSSGLVEEHAKKRVPFWRRQVPSMLKESSYVFDAEKGVNISKKV
jgi:hypothetical protein